MNKLHIALSTHDIEATVRDYTVRLGCPPVLVVSGAYALWRTPILNLSVRNDPSCAAGELRHLGWEDASAEEFTTDTDVNGILWERFAAQTQADEINEIWPETSYRPEE